MFHWNFGIDCLILSRLIKCSLDYRGIVDMLLISFKGFGNWLNGRVLWRVAVLFLIWFLLWKRNASIFEDIWGFDLLLLLRVLPSNLGSRFQSQQELKKNYILLSVLFQSITVLCVSLELNWIVNKISYFVLMSASDFWMHMCKYGWTSMCAICMEYLFHYVSWV